MKSIQKQINHQLRYQLRKQWRQAKGDRVKLLEIKQQFYNLQAGRPLNEPQS